MSKCDPSRVRHARSDQRSVVLVIPDLHAPFMHEDACPFIDAVIKRHEPTQIVLIGDVADQHSLSRFTRDPSGLSSGDEFAAATKQLAPLYSIIPTALVCWGNHDRRVYDRAAEVGIPASAIRPMRSILAHPIGWRWGDRWRINGVGYEHGDNWSGRDAHIKAANANMECTVIGHIHSHAGINYVANRRHLFFGFNVGCLINHEAYAFQYAKRNPAKPIIGVGIIDGRAPSFIPMNLKTGGRWKGSL